MALFLGKHLYRKYKAKRQGDDPIDLLETAHRQEEDPESILKPGNQIAVANSIDKKSLPAEEKTRRAEEKRARRNYRWRIFAGIMLPFTVQALDLTLVAGAVTYIASDFHQLAQLNWIISAFNLTASAFVPQWGQFADVFGRYYTMQAAAFFVIFGSAMCAGAPTNNFPMFCAGRAIQGIGTSGFLILSKIILADKVSLAENAKNNSIFSLVGGLGFSIGPVIGGYLTSASWRWCFIINIPLCLIAIPVSHFCLRPVVLGPQAIGEQQSGDNSDHRPMDSLLNRLATIDYGGQIIFLFGFGLLILALTWAGAIYPWKSAEVVATMTVAIALLVIFIGWELIFVQGGVLSRVLSKQQAMIPMSLVLSRNAGILMYINFITGMAMYAVFYFIDIYFTIVKGYDAGKAGVSLLYYIPGLGTGVYAAMFSCNVWPKMTYPPLMLGTIIEAVGIVLIAVSLRTETPGFIYGMLAVTGFGTGIRLMPGTIHGVGYYRKNIASIIILMSLAIYLGNPFASTIMTNIFNNRLANAGVNLVSHSTKTTDLKMLANLPTAQLLHIRDVAKHAIVTSFFAISSFMWFGVIAMLFLGNVNIKNQCARDDVDEFGETNVGHLTQGAYLKGLFGKREAIPT